MEVKINGINIFNPLEGKLDEIIECFVEFYGEKHREKITNNIKSAEYFFVPQNQLGPLSGEIDSFFKREIRLLYDEFYEKISLNGRKMPNYLGAVIDISRLQEIKKELEKTYEGDAKHHSLWLFEGDLNCYLQYMGILKTAEDLAKEQAEKEGVPFGSVQYECILKGLRSEKRNDEELAEYFKIPANRNQFYDFVEMCEVKFIELGYDKLVEDLKQQQESAQMNVKEVDAKIQNSRDKANEKLNEFTLGKMRKILGERSGEIENWSKYDTESTIEEYHRLLDLDLKKDLAFLGDYSKEMLVKLFNKLGFDLGEKLEDYVSNSEIQEKVIDADTVLEYLAIKKENKKDLEDSNQIFNECLSAIQKRELTQAETMITSGLLKYMNGCLYGNAYVTAGVSEKGIEPFLVCKWGAATDWSLESYLDLELVHELGHVVTNSAYTKDGDLWWKCGFDGENYSKREVSGKSVTERKYEALNEIINDYFTQDIYKLIREKGIVLNPGKQEQESASSYSYGFNLLGGFIEKHKEEIIDSLMSDDPMAFAEIIGKQNYEELAEACTQYLELAGNLDRYLDFAKQTKLLSEKHQISFFDATQLPQDWEERLLPYAECFKKVAEINKKLTQAKNKTAEINL